MGAEYTVAQAAVTAGGSFTLVTLNEKVFLPYAQPGQSTETIDNVFVYFWQAILAPPRLAGRILVVHDTVDQVKQPRSAWTYNPGQRRVRRAPQVAYDNPGNACLVAYSRQCFYSSNISAHGTVRADSLFGRLFPRGRPLTCSGVRTFAVYRFAAGWFFGETEMSRPRHAR